VETKRRKMKKRNATSNKEYRAAIEKGVVAKTRCKIRKSKVK